MCRNFLAVNICIQTILGDIVAELYPQQAPITVANFVDNINAGLFNSAQFHRAACSHQLLPGKDRGIAVVEAGPWQGAQNLAPIVHESTLVSGLLNHRGVLAMSRDEPGSAAAGFFINVDDNPSLNAHEAADGKDAAAGYATFGRVTRGMAVVDTIHQQATGQKRLSPDEADFMERFKQKDAVVAQWYSKQLLNSPVLIERVSVVEECEQ